MSLREAQYGKDKEVAESSIAHFISSVRKEEDIMNLLPRDPFGYPRRELRQHFETDSVPAPPLEDMGHTGEEASEEPHMRNDNKAVTVEVEDDADIAKEENEEATIPVNSVSVPEAPVVNDMIAPVLPPAMNSKVEEETQTVDKVGDLPDDLKDKVQASLDLYNNMNGKEPSLETLTWTEDLDDTLTDLVNSNSYDFDKVAEGLMSRGFGKGVRVTPEMCRERWVVLDREMDSEGQTNVDELD